jgi:hypothetical protein
MPMYCARNLSPCLIFRSGVETHSWPATIAVPLLLSARLQTLYVILCMCSLPDVQVGCGNPCPYFNSSCPPAAVHIGCRP